MKVIRSMVLVSVDETSLARGAQDVFRAFWMRLKNSVCPTRLP